MKLYHSFRLTKPSHVEHCCAFIRANWEAFSATKEPLCVEIMPQGARRSLEQNKRLHAMLADIAEQAWVNGRQYDAETWKEQFRRQFIGTEEITLPSGETLVRGISTTTLTVAEFADFMTKIEVYASQQLGLEFS